MFGQRLQGDERLWTALDKLLKKRLPTDKPFELAQRTILATTKRQIGRHGLTPNTLRRSCIADLPNAGRELVFDIPEKDRIFLKVEQNRKEESQCPSIDLFDEFLKAIKSFGDSIKKERRIKTINGEKEFQRLFEGYMLARFSNENIRPEVRFYGHKENSTIDFTVVDEKGEQEIPIELKFGGKREIGDCLRKGVEQVREFLIYRKSERGILVFGDKEQDLDNQRHNGIEDKVHIIVI